MNSGKSFIVLIGCLGFMMSSALSAAESLPLAVKNQVSAQITKSESELFKRYLQHIQDASADKRLEAENAIRVAQQLLERKERDPITQAAATYFAVPPMSSIKRLENTYPSDGDLSGPLQIIAARKEYEAASFVVYPFTTLDNAQLEKTSLTSDSGEIISESNIDLKIVKIWYQGGTAWYSYFADTTGRELIPELLLNDETLIKVDHDTKDNYLRVNYPTGPQYLWISNPLGPNIPFNAETTPVADAEFIQPFSLAAGAFKQFMVTVKIPDETKAGIYKGLIQLILPGHPSIDIPLAVKVLPFELPSPRTYYDSERDFYTMLYTEPHLGELLTQSKGDMAHAEAKMRALYTNMREHNILNPIMRGMKSGGEEIMRRELEIYKSVGLNTNPFFGAVPGIPPYAYMKSLKDTPLADQPYPQDLLKQIDSATQIVKEMLGHTNVYCFMWDEPSMDLLVAQRKTVSYLHEKGLMTYSTGQDKHLKYGGYYEDIINVPGEPSRARAAHWHAIGGKIINYAAPHTGPENPDVMRRVHGLQLYKAHYDGIGNYILAAERWNDFLGEKYNFRAFNMTYPTQNGVIDTLAWEGMREAVDDVRYATKLKKLANAAIASKKVNSIYSGRQALQWLEMLDEKHDNLDVIRLEMISYILKLQNLQ